MANPLTKKITAGSLIALYAVVGFAIYFAFGFSYGPIVTSDGLRDLFYADKLIEIGLNPFKFSETTTPFLNNFGYSVPPTNFLVYIYVLAGLHYFLEDQWIAGLLVVNVIAQTVTTVLLLLIVRDLTKNLLSIGIAGLFIITGFEFFQWISMTQSDSLFLMTVTIIFYFLTRYSIQVESSARRRNLTLAVGLALGSLLVRPSGMAIVAALIAILALVFLSRNCSDRGTVRWFLLIFVSAALIVFGALVLHGNFLHNPETLSDGVLRSRIEYLKQTFDLGWVVWARPETFINPPSLPFEYTELSLRRLYYFFWFIGDTYSYVHKTMNILYFPPFYGLVLVGVFLTITFVSAIPTSSRRMAMFALFLIFAINSLHAATILDYDWRFRAPALPGFVVLFSIGLRYSLCRIKALRRLMAKLDITH
jgi:hypothetical protein